MQLESGLDECGNNLKSSPTDTKLATDLDSRSMSSCISDDSSSMNVRTSCQSRPSVDGCRLSYFLIVRIQHNDLLAYSFSDFTHSSMCSDNVRIVLSKSSATISSVKSGISLILCAKIFKNPEHL